MSSLLGRCRMIPSFAPRRSEPVTSIPACSDSRCDTQFTFATVTFRDACFRTSVDTYANMSVRGPPATFYRNISSKSRNSDTTTRLMRWTREITGSRRLPDRHAFSSSHAPSIRAINKRTEEGLQPLNGPNHRQRRGAANGSHHAIKESAAARPGRRAFLRLRWPQLEDQSNDRSKSRRLRRT